MSPRCLREDTPPRRRLASAERTSNQSQNGLRGQQHALPPAALGHRMHQSRGNKKKCCYFKEEPLSPPATPPHPTPRSLVEHILDSWVNLPSLAYPSKPR